MKMVLILAEDKSVSEPEPETTAQDDEQHEGNDQLAQQESLSPERVQ